MMNRRVLLAALIFVLMMTGAAVVSADEAVTPVEDVPNALLALLAVPVAIPLIAALTQWGKTVIPVSPVLIQLALTAVAYLLWQAAVQFNLETLYESGVGFLIALLPVVIGAGNEVFYRVAFHRRE